MPEPRKPSNWDDERYRKAHHYYHANDNITDLSQMRKEAEARIVDRRMPEDSVIHFHSYSEKEESGCNLELHNHEFYTKEVRSGV